MEVKETEIKSVYIVEPSVHKDDRGYFFESFNAREFNDKTKASFYPVQDNESKSCKGVLRGLHFQKSPYAQAKLVRVVKGRVFDVAVDLREDSDTYGKWTGVELTEDNHKQFFIPKGFAHGFAVLSDEAIFQYKCDNYWAPEYEDGIAWDSVGIDWESITGLDKDSIILSAKDTSRKTLEEYIEKNKH